MRVLICPDKFAGTIDAGDAARAIAAGWTATAPDDHLELRPLSDGGPGFVDVLGASSDGTVIPVSTTDPLGRPVTGKVLVVGETGYVESAQACGLHLLKAEERDPKITTSYGLGALVVSAIEAGAREVVIGLGGSGTNDGGAGFLAALGIVGVDVHGQPLPPGGAALARCDRLTWAGWSGAGTGDDEGGVIDAGRTGARLPGRPEVRLVAAADVDNPLTGPRGASPIYAPQKGASSADVRLLDEALRHWGAVLERDLDRGADLDGRPGAGAAGGLGAAILALGGEMRSGIGLVRELTSLDEALDRADLVITGEGSLDGQSLAGKVVAGVANGARARGVPCVVLAGTSSADVSVRVAAGVTSVYTLEELFGSIATALRRPAEGLTTLAGRLAGPDRALIMNRAS